MSMVPALDLRGASPASDPVGQLPYNIEAEQAVLGAVLYDGSAMDHIEGLGPSHFHEPLHGELWEWTQDRIASGQLADIVLAAKHFDQHPAMEELGGLTYLADLVDRAPPPANAGAYAREVIELAGRRALLILMGDLMARARNPALGPLDQVLADLEAGAGEVAESAEVANRWLNPADLIGAAIERAQASNGVIEFPSGIPDLDRVLGGLHRKEVTILAARPGMGKTIAGQLFARETARSGRATLFFSLEMGGEPMGLRLACDLAYDRDAAWYSGVTSNVTLEKVARNELSEHQWERLQETRRTVAKWPLLYEERPALTMGRIESLARRKFREFERRGVPRGLIVIDHMGKVKPSRDRKGNKHAEVADISAEASEMAKRLDVPVLLLCQLNRQVEGRNDKLPMLSDLRQAGEIEEDARQVVFLYRPEYHLRAPAENETPTDKIEREAKLDAARNKLFWIVEKNSNGPRGQVLTFCDVSASAIREWRP